MDHPQNTKLTRMYQMQADKRNLIVIRKQGNEIEISKKTSVIDDNDNDRDEINL